MGVLLLLTALTIAIAWSRVGRKSSKMDFVYAGALTLLALFAYFIGA